MLVDCLRRSPPYGSTICKYCREQNDSVVKFGGPPTGAKKERQVLKHEALCLDEEDDDDEKPQTKLTEYR